MAVRALVAHAHALGREIPALVAEARQFVRLDASRHAPLIDESLAILLDRLALSISLGRPVALAAWGELEVQRLGSAAVLEMLGAARKVMLDSAKRKGIDRQRFGLCLDGLCGVIQNALGDACDRELDAAALRDAARDQATRALLATLWERDGDVERHCQETAEWTLRLAPALELPAESTAFLTLCARLHDIGKVAIPDAILRKPGPLEQSEWKIMRDHAAAGARILNQIPSLQRCAIIVRAHHERYDGTGYPDRLKGTEIPFEARVIAVADAFHAMISKRPYREAVAPRRALEILTEGRGSQWEPALVDTMLSVVNRPFLSAASTHARSASATA